MGCFSTCFQKSNRRKPLRPRSRRPTPRLNQLIQLENDQEFIGPSDFDTLQALPLMEITEGGNIEEAINPLPDSVDVKREKLNPSGRKKVTFDLNVKFYEDLSAEDNEPERDFQVKSINDEMSEKERKARKEEKNQSHSDSSSSSSLFSFPPSGYRYQNCDSDDEFDQVVSDDESDLDPYLSDGDEDEEEVNNDHLVEAKEGSSESLFSLSIDSRKHKLSNETGDKEVNSPMPVKPLDKDEDEDEADRITNFDSVLNPVENLTQWKAIKARAKLTSQNKAKENKNSGRESNIPVIEEPILKPPVNSKMGNSAKSKNSNKEIAVDASLSTWLVGSEPASPSVSKTSSASIGNSPQSYTTCSPKDFEDRPILGALTVEEINQFSAASTPRKSPSRSPDDMPIIGTVGSYWSHTGQGTGTSSDSGSYSKGTSNTRSNFRQGSKLNFNSSTTFEKRSEGVLQESTA